MNRFYIMPCIDQNEINEDSPNGLVVPLASEMQNNCVLFFPISDEIGSLINYLLEEEETDPQQIHMIEVFKTMIKTWKSGDRFLSGIFIDIIYDSESGEDTIAVNLILSATIDGYVEAVIKINFIHAIIIAVLEDMNIMISNELLNKLLPEIADSEEDVGDKDSIFPVDEDILNIAKKIMDGKIK